VNHQMAGKKALICGISGQDGAYLAELLLRKGYSVTGTSRDAQTASFRNLEFLNIRDQVACESMAPNNFRSVLQVLTKVEPDEIYNLAGQSSVGLSFEQPVETMKSNAVGTLNLLEAIRCLGSSAKLYNAGSSECFGNTGSQPADENTPFHPRSPYAVAKAAAYWEVANYRDAYGLYACTGILFNHESPLRPEHFVTQKIVSGAHRIANGSNEKMMLGNLDVVRDWGWAPEYVSAMWSMLQIQEPVDLVIATGESFSLRQFVQVTFEIFSLDWKDYVRFDQSLIRPSDLLEGRANPSKAANVIKWRAQSKMTEVITMMAMAVQRTKATRDTSA
jgi:GDPmannose 4,6-dehydratase